MPPRPECNMKDKLLSETSKYAREKCCLCQSTSIPLSAKPNNYMQAHLMGRKNSRGSPPLSVISHQSFTLFTLYQGKLISLYQVVPSGQKSGAANLELNKPIVDAEFLEFANKPIVGDGENKPIMGAEFLEFTN